MFWKQIEEISINDILIKEDVNLENVLDHESLLQECRSQNETLVKFFTQESNYIKLLKYIIITPDEEDITTRFKYPSLSCEVLTSDIPAINTLLVIGLKLNDEDKSCVDFGRPYFEQFFDILSHQDNINPLVMSFCIKIFLNILKFDNDIVMKSVTEKANCMDVLLGHIDSNAIVHFFTEFVQCEDDVVDSRKQWLHDNKFILKLTNLLGSTEYRNNSIQILFSNILWYMSLGSINKILTNELTVQLNEQGFLDLIFVHISSTKSDSSLISTCLKIVKNVVDLEIKIEGKLNFCVELIRNHFESLVNLLNKPPKQIYESMPTTVGLLRPFGPARINIVNLLESLLKLDSPEIIEIVLQSQILAVLLKHVSEFKWNSQFHLSFLRVLAIIFSNLSPGNKNYSLQKHLVQELGIFQWFFELFDNLESEKPRPGYSGILWKIGNFLDSLKNSDISADLLTGNGDTAFEEKWLHIIDDYLKPKNAYSKKGESFQMDSGMKEFDQDLNIVEIDEAEIEANSNNPDAINDYFRSDASENLDDMFGPSFLDHGEEDWITNQLHMPSAPIDDFRSNFQVDISSDDSTSSDEESPAVIRQKPQGNAAKYILSDFHAVSSGSCSDLNDLPDVPESSDVEFTSLEFNDPWSNKLSDNNLVHDNWAKF